MNWMIYGANGYTGKLIAKKAVEKGLRPILAGRNGQKIRSLAQQLDLPFQIFSCDDSKKIETELQSVHTILNCAGPFRFTFKQIFKACLDSGTNYLDITGEIRVFEKIIASKSLLQEKGIIAIGGVGFDVVPTDCIANMLKEKLPDANQLTLAIKLEAGASPGSAKTLIEAFYAGGLIRKDGEFKLVPPAFITENIVFNQSPETTISLPWGDISTAYHSTSIPNIVVLFRFPRKIIRLIRWT